MSENRQTTFPQITITQNLQSTKRIHARKTFQPDMKSLVTLPKPQVQHQFRRFPLKVNPKVIQAFSPYQSYSIMSYNDFLYEQHKIEKQLQRQKEKKEQTKLKDLKEKEKISYFKQQDENNDKIIDSIMQKVRMELGQPSIIFIFIVCAKKNKIDNQEHDFHPLKIKIYDKYLKKSNPNHKLFKSLLKQAEKFISQTYSIEEQKQKKLRIDIDKCNHVQIPKKHQTKGIKHSDFILYVVDKSENASWIAKSVPCLTKNNRPIAGILELNNLEFHKLKKSKRHGRLGTIIHEITHTLGFHSDILKQLNMTSNIDGKNYIITKGIVEYAKQFYNCSSLDKILLEDDGGSQSEFSHFEKLTFNEEIMTGTASLNMPYSNFTLHLMQDTGLYKVNFNKAEKYVWGQNMGCQVTTGSCISPTICQESEENRFCSYNYQFIQKCRPHQTLAECGLKTSMTDCQQKKCFNTIDQQAKCLKSKCIKEGIEISYQQYKGICLKENQTITINGEQILCPKFENFCNDQFKCNNRGVFKNQKCHCNYGYKGKRCQKYV